MISNTRFISRTFTGLLVFTLAVRALETLGIPGVDYPDYSSIPKTSFSCIEQKYFPGFYADVEAGCQVFHLCLKDGQESFLCPTGTTYNQEKLTCDPWYNSNCSLATLSYSVNSGPVMESARKNIPMLIKLRNRSQNRQATRQPTADVYEKITSLYERTADEEQAGIATSNLAEHAEAESNLELESDEMQDEPRLNEDLFSRLDESDQSNEEFQEHLHYSDSLGQEAEDSEPGILYDPVTEQYYVDYVSMPNDWQSDPADEANNYRSVYDYDSFADNDGFALNDFVDESTSDIESEVEAESTVNLEDFKHMLETAEKNDREQFRRMLDTDNPYKRVRRPLYTVVREDEVEVPGVPRGVQYPFQDSDYSPFTIEPIATDSDVGSELPELVHGRLEIMEETNPDGSIETTEELQYNFTPLNTSEESLTPEEFEQTILSELVLPKTDGLDLRFISLPSEVEHEESSVSQDFQDNRFSSAEDVFPNDYESYSAEYNGDDTVTVSPESDREIHGSGGTTWYQSGEGTSVEGSLEVDDTYVVVPDESDGNVFEQQSEDGEAASVEGSLEDDTYVVIPDESDGNVLEQQSDEQAKSLDESSYYSVESDDQYQSEEAYNSYEALKNYFLSKYASPDTYASEGPYGYQAPEFYFSNEFRGLQPVSRGFFNPDDSELSQSPFEYAADSSYVQGFNVGYPYENSPEGYSFADHMYGTENGYYGEFYDSPYVEDTSSLGYDTTELEDSAEYSTLNIPTSDFMVDREDAGPEISSWVQSHLTESSETVDQFGVTDSSIPTEDILTESSRAYLSEMLEPQESSEVVPIEDNESMKQSETYYLFDFDEDSQKRADIKLNDNVETSDSGSEKLNSGEWFQTKEPWQPNESLGDASSTDGNQSESTETEEIQTSDSDFASNVNVNFPDVPVTTKFRDLAASFQTESSRANDKPVTLSSTLEQLAGLKTGKPSIGSDASSFHPSRSNFLNGMEFPVNVDFGSYSVADIDKHYSIPEASVTPSTENVYSHRSGNLGQPQISKLSVIQERIRSLKHGKFGAFKRYMNSADNKD